MRWLVGLLVWSLAGTSVVSAKAPNIYPPSGVLTFKGLDDTSAPTQAQDGRAQDLQNIVLGVSYDMRKRYGISLVGGTLDVPDEDFCAVTGTVYTKFSNGTERIVATCGTRARYLSGSTWALIPGGRLTAGQNNQFVFTTALDNLIATNGVDVPWQWNGGANASIAPVAFSGLTNTIQSARAAAFFKNYLIFGYTTEAGTIHSTRIRWSNVGTINTWTDADFVDISSLGGQELVGFGELYDNLYVFFTNSIYRLSLVGGASTFNVSKVVDGVGAIAKNSIQTVILGNGQSGLVFLDKDKQVYFYNGSVAQDISQLISVTMGGLSASRLPYAVSADTGTDYLLCTTTGSFGANNLCLDFQYQTMEWTKHVNIPANAMAQVLDNNSVDQVYLGSYKSFVYQYQDTSLTDDVGNATGTVSAVDVYTTSTASSLQVLYNSSANLETGALAGAPLEITSGLSSGSTAVIVDNTATGLIIDTVLTPTPDTTSNYEVGAIDAYYTTKWYDFGEPSRLKHFGELYFWADSDVDSTISVGLALDFNADVITSGVALSSGGNSLWGTAIWGTSVWASGATTFQQVKEEGSGRYARWKFADDDPGESFHLYGMSPFYWAGEVQ